MKGILEIRKADWPEKIEVPLDGETIFKVKQAAAVQATLATGAYISPGEFERERNNYQSICYRGREVDYDEETDQTSGWYVGLTIFIPSEMVEAVRQKLISKLENEPGTVIRLMEVGFMSFQDFTP